MFQALESPSLIQIPGWLCQLGDLGQGTRISLDVLIWKMEIILLTLQYEGIHQSNFPQKTLVPPPHAGLISAFNMPSVQL